jgi:hypothetical protein
MPVLGLLVGTLVPAAVVLAVPDVGHLADLYAIGVVGAVAINLGACLTNWNLELRPRERYPMLALAGLMVAIWLTIAWEKPWALAFAGTIVAVGLAGRVVAHRWQDIGNWLTAPVWGAPEIDAEILARTSKTRPAQQPLALPPAQVAAPRRILVCTHGNLKLVDFAIEQARLQQAELLVLFVRHLAVLPAAPLSGQTSAGDAEAEAAFALVRQRAREQSVRCYCLYAISPYVADTILETAVTHGVAQLILGVSQRGGLWRAMKGDVIQEVAQYLPEPITLVIAT